ncbi:MAG TPA: CPBP family intramembrane metalloprotease [Caldilineae bacterium]|jgi:membrane protease YdiL (CAAX protease family)|nr:CPBP family intramembrane metalloprotease [Caldilineae bacterium]
MIDRKGMFSYLAITFVITYAIEGVLILAGFRMTDIPPLYGQLVIAGVMWVPALATVLTIKFVTREGFAITNFRIGSWRPYLKTALVIPAGFVVIYGLTWLIGLGQPDWQLAQFRELMASAGADVSEMPPSSVFLPALFLATLIITPFINSIFGFGEEFGWRGYLLPKLMPLGRARAYVLTGVIWGLWHAPIILVGFNYPGYPILGVIWMAGMTTALSLYMNELTLRHRSSILAGWMHGVFNSQGYGIWRLLFPDVNPLLGGLTGLVGIAVWLAPGLWEMRRRPAADA